MVELRPYQNELIDLLRSGIIQGHKRLILCSPTGSGKTIMFSYMVAEHLKRGGRILIVTHRLELLNQSSGAFSKFSLSPTLITAGSKPDLTQPLHVAMVETLHRRAASYSPFLASRTMIIFDEAHIQSFNKLFSFIGPDTIVIGATATPFREGSQSSLDEFYTFIAQKVDTPDLIDLNFLSKPKSFGVDLDLSKVKKTAGDFDANSLGNFYDENKIFEGVIDNYIRLTPDKKAILFSSNVKSSENICLQFISKGIPSKHIDAKTPKAKRKEILDWFYNVSGPSVLCNCGILTTGFDCPNIEVVILYRATTKLPLFLQMVGRGSRTTPDKSSFTILDFGNNIKRHDFWESPRTWTIKKKPKKEKNSVAPAKTCKKCGMILPAQAINCSGCGYEFPKKKIKTNNIAHLVELTPKQIYTLTKKGSLSIQELVELSKEKKIKPFFALHTLTTKEEGEEFVKQMGWKPGFVFHNKHRFKCFQ